MPSLSRIAAILFCLAQARADLTCANCHAKQAATQPTTSMGRALLPPANDPLFQKHSKLTTQKGSFTYSIEMRDGALTYSVTNGAETVSAPVHWIFGAGSQTFVLERNGRFFESLVSYYKGIEGLDTTIGDQNLQPKTVDEAFGRPLAPTEITLCFGCHSSDAVHDHKLNLARVTPGLTCAHCHSGAEDHLQAISTGKLTSLPPKLKQSSPEEISAFCGQCHRTWETVVRNGWLGTVNVRFQPYRLENSKCFDGIDRRLSCIVCHDPHKEVVRESAAYDGRCQACHSADAKVSPGMTALHPGVTTMKTCPVSTKNCAGCHMPKIPLGGAHELFTDHDIRVVHGDAYPN